MGTVTPFRRREAEPPPADLRGRAMDNLRFIRATMERAGVLTAVPGWGQVVIGVTALAAAAAAQRAPSRETWLAVWIAEAALSIAIGAYSMARKARRLSVPFLSPAGRRFALTFSLPILVGAALTAALHGAGAYAVLPGLWLLLYGTAVAAGGAFSVSLVPVMGYCFMAAGLGALLAPPEWANGVLGAAFGGLHVLFGLAIARRHGG